MKTPMKTPTPYQRAKTKMLQAQAEETPVLLTLPELTAVLTALVSPDKPSPTPRCQQTAWITVNGNRLSRLCALVQGHHGPHRPYWR